MVNVYEDGNVLYASNLNSDNNFISKPILENYLKGNIALNNTISNDTSVTETDGVCVGYDNYLYFGRVVDVFEDSSIDTTLWTTSGTVIESGGRIAITNGSIVLNGTNAPDYSTDNFNVYIYVGNNAGIINEIKITDNTNTVNLGTFDNVYILLKFDSTAKTVTFWTNTTNYTGSGTTVDLSSLTNYYLKIVNSTSSYQVYVYYIIDDYTTATVTYEKSTASNITSSSTGFATSINVLNTPTYIYLSANNGSNYTDCYDSWGSLTTGTQGKIKCVKEITSAGGLYAGKFGGWFN